MAAASRRLYTNLIQRGDRHAPSVMDWNRLGTYFLMVKLNDPPSNGRASVSNGAPDRTNLDLFQYFVAAGQSVTGKR